MPEDDFVHHFAGDIDPVQARVMYAVQPPLAASTFEDVMGVPAWKSHPSWYLVAENDQAIPPDAERQFAKRMGATTIEVPTGHVAMVSHPTRWRSSSRPLPKRSRPPVNGYLRRLAGLSGVGLSGVGLSRFRWVAADLDLRPVQFQAADRAVQAGRNCPPPLVGVSIVARPSDARTTCRPSPA